MAKKRRKKGTPHPWGVWTSEEVPNIGMPSIMGWISLQEQRYVVDKLEEIARELREARNEEQR